MKPPRVVLFDFDGVLADTENVHVVAWERTLDRMGWVVGPEVCARAAEIDDRHFLREVLKERGVEDGDIEGWTRQKQALTRRLLAEGAVLFPGVKELIERLHGRARLAVVTGTWRENAALVLGAKGVRDAFELIVGKEDVTETKPSPEAYQYALKRLRVSARSAVALEDSPSGVAAARGANVACVAIGHRRPQGEWCDETRFLPGLTDLGATLEALGFDPADLGVKGSRA